MKRLLCALCMLCALTGCAGPSAPVHMEQSTEYTIGVLLKGMESAHWMDMRSGLRDAARAYNVNVVLLYPAREDAVEEQQQMFRDLVARKPDAILFAPCDSDHCAPLADLAQENGVPLLNIDTASADVQLPYIGADNERLGRLAAERLAQRLGGSGRVAVIAGTRQQSSHADRIEGFRASLTAYPRMKLGGIYHADSDFRLAMEATAQIMRSSSATDGIFCTNAVMALGALEQMRAEEYAKKPYVVAVDTQDDALDALRQGTLDALVTQDGYECGYQAIAHTVARLRGDPVQDKVYISGTLVTADTVETVIEARSARTEGQYDEGTSGR